MKWFGPDACHALSVDFDLRIGGAYRILLSTSLFGEIEVAGVFREVDFPRRLVYSWTWHGHPAMEFGETLVTVEFKGIEAETELQLTHERFPTLEVCDDHNYGWNGCLDKLEAQLSTAHPA